MRAFDEGNSLPHFVAEREMDSRKNPRAFLAIEVHKAHCPYL